MGMYLSFQLSKNSINFYLSYNVWYICDAVFTINVNSTTLTSFLYDKLHTVVLKLSQIFNYENRHLRHMVNMYLDMPLLKIKQNSLDNGSVYIAMVNNISEFIFRIK